MEINNPYLYHPHPLLKRAADDICFYIASRQDWASLFEQGKMLGALLCADGTILKAYSGVINGLRDEEHYFVPPIYDLANPDDFYLQEDEAITALNRQIADCTDATQRQTLQQERKERSLALQLKIFRHFNFLNASGEYKNIIDIFQEAKRGLPPGGAGECAAPRLLQQAFKLHLTPIAIAEFWYGRSPKVIRRVHGQFYPSCIEKCSPILKETLQTLPQPSETHPQPSLKGREQNELEDKIGEIDSIRILAEFQVTTPLPTQVREGCGGGSVGSVRCGGGSFLILHKPAGMLSVPAKDTTLPNVESWLKSRYPECKLPFMLVHRLDQATSGLLLAAKDAQTHKLLQQAFEQRTIHKRYVAWLEGELASECGVISLPICPNPDDRPRQTVDWQFGKPAVTRYNVLKREAGRTLVELFPLTGRTHQLRLHCASPFGLSKAIIGDELYFAKPSKRLMLHAESIYFPESWNSWREKLPPFEGGLGVGLSGLLELREGIPLEFHDPSGFE